MTHLLIEENLKPFLQRNIQITVDNKIIREGKLILFNLKDYHIILTIKIKGKNKTYEIPYPFVSTVETPDILAFDYRLKHIHRDAPEIKSHKVFLANKTSRLYNAVVYMKSYINFPLAKS